MLDGLRQGRVSPETLDRPNKKHSNTLRYSGRVSVVHVPDATLRAVE
jgi:hypothetical protein